MTPTSFQIMSQPAKYHKNTRLDWFATLVGDASREMVMIASPNKSECLKAAKIFYAEAKESDIQPVRIRTRAV